MEGDLRENKNVCKCETLLSERRARDAIFGAVRVQI